MTNHDRATDTDGRGTLAGRLPSLQPPAALEERVRTTLVRQRLVAQRGRFALTPALGVGLAAAGFALGFLAHASRHDAAPSHAVPAARQYVLLLYGKTEGDTGAVHLAREREYGRWATSLTDGVRWVGGNELHELVSSVGPAGSGSSEAPAAAERLAGYFVIEAASPASAVAAARTCPHVRYGGRVVVMAVAS